MTANSPEPHSQDVTARLGLWDAVSIIVGIVVGTSIFKSSPMVFNNVPNAWVGMGAWVLGGVLSFIGALCYAELATTYPRMGGDYVYLSRAFGKPVGFLFGWAQLAVILTGSIGAMAYAFGDYSVQYFDNRFGKEGDLAQHRDLAIVAFAAGSVIVLSLLNLIGVIFGKTVQNLLSVLKVLGLLAIVIAGIGWGTGESPKPEPKSAAPPKTPATKQKPPADKSNTESVKSKTGTEAPKTAADKKTASAKSGEKSSDPAKKTEKKEPTFSEKLASFGLAMVFVLYAFGGWNDAAFVASEVRDRHRNLPWALLYGIAGITVVYLLVNVGYLWGLGFEGLKGTFTPASDVLAGPFGENGSKVMSMLVMLSALGALNGLIFTGSRIFTALGQEHTVFAALGRWDPRLGVPIWSILAQAVVSLLLIFAVGTEMGRNAVDNSLSMVNSGPLPWGKYFGGFNTLVAGTAPVFWLFFLLTGVSLFVLRSKDPQVDRPFSVPLYPVVPLIFCGTSVYMLYSSMTYAKELSLLGFVPLAVGIPLYFFSRKTGESKPGL